MYAHVVCDVMLCFQFHIPGSGAADMDSGHYSKRPHPPSSGLHTTVCMYMAALPTEARSQAPQHAGVYCVWRACTHSPVKWRRQLICSFPSGELAEATVSVYEPAGRDQW